MKITIKDLVKDITTPTGYRDKDTGRFVSMKDIELFESWFEIKKKYEVLKPKIPEDKKKIIESELRDLMRTIDDDNYEAPHEYFKISSPEWSEMDETTLRKIVGRYFLVDNLTEAQKKKGIKPHPSNVMAMEYSLVKLKIEKLQEELNKYD